MKTKILFMLLVMPLIVTACSNDDEKEDELVGYLTCFVENEISFYNADGTECDLGPYVDDLDDTEMSIVIERNVDGLVEDYVENRSFDEETDSIVGNKMYVEMLYAGQPAYVPIGDVDFYFKLKSSKMFGNEEEHVIRVVLDGTKGLLYDEGFITSVDSQTLPITWQAEYEKPSSWKPTLSIKVVLPER